MVYIPNERERQDTGGGNGNGVEQGDNRVILSLRAQPAQLGRQQTKCNHTLRLYPERSVEVDGGW